MFRYGKSKSIDFAWISWLSMVNRESAADVYLLYLELQKPLPGEQ